MRLFLTLLLTTSLVIVAGCGRRVARKFATVGAAIGPAPTAVDVGVAKDGPEPKADGKPASFWIGTLQDKDQQIRAGAAKTLSGLKDDAVDVLVIALKNPDAEVRSQAVAILNEIGEEGGRAQPALILALKDDSDTVRGRAASALAKIGPSADAVAALQRASADPSDTVREKATAALGYAGAEAKNAIEPLMERLKDKNDKVREQAAWALGHIGPDSKPAVGLLTEALKDPNAAVCFSALEALGHIGPPAQTAVPALTDVVKEKGAKVPFTAVDALGNIGPGVVPVLLEVLKVPDGDIRAAGLNALADALQAPDVDPSPELLAQIAKQTEAAVPAVTALLKEEKVSVRRKAVEILASCRTKAKSAAPALKELANDPDEDVRKKAGEALKKIGAD
jgi:HEAT repeat protein